MGFFGYLRGRSRWSGGRGGFCGGRSAGGDIVFVLRFVEIAVARHIPREFGTSFFFLKGGQDLFLDHFPASGIDRMGDIGIELQPALGIFRGRRRI
jgi:hypothetical protein